MLVENEIRIKLKIPIKILIKAFFLESKAEYNPFWKLSRMDLIISFRLQL